MVERARLITGKKGQGTMGVPFQMIFSIILIAIFLYAAFTGIKYFLERADQAQIGKFVVDVQAKVGTIWQTTEASQSYYLDLPKRIEHVCFGDLSMPTETCPDFELYREQARIKGSNVFFCPPEAAYGVGMPVHFRVDCSGNNCLQTKQPGLTCLENVEGRVTIKLEKDIGSPLVIIS